MVKSRAFVSLEAYETEIDKKRLEITKRKQELQELLGELVKENVPYRYLTAVSAVLERVKEDENSIMILGGELWCRATDEFLKCMHNAG